MLVNLGIGYLAVLPGQLAALAVGAPEELADDGGPVLNLGYIGVLWAVVLVFFLGVNVGVIRPASGLGGPRFWAVAVVALVVPWLLHW